MANFQGGISGGSALNQQPTQSPDGGGWVSSGGGGGNYNVTYSKEREPIDTEDLNAQLANAASALKKQNAATAKAGKDSLDNIKKQREANAQQLLMKNAQLARNSEWQPNQQKEQSVLANMRRTMGNAAYGSGMQDLQEGMARFDDMADVELINTWKENQDEAYNNWYQANADLISDYNEQAIRTRSAFDEAYNNYLGNIANINSKLGRQAYAINWDKESEDTNKQQYKELSQELGFDRNKENGIEEDEKEGEITAKIWKNNAINNYDMADLLTKLENKASSNNPNIPNNNGAIDYIRPRNAVATRSLKANGLGNINTGGGSVNTSMGAFSPSKRKLPGYNYQRENFNNHIVKR